MGWLFDGWLAPITNPMAFLPVPEETCDDSAEHMLKFLESELRQRVQQGWDGHNPSIVRGHGLDFADLREYTPGDDIRKIDWNVFARTLSPHIKEFLEEKQLTVWVFVDLTPSMFFGGVKSKARMVVELAGLIGLLTHYGRNKLGVFCMAAEVSWMLPPRAGYEQTQMAMQRLLASESQGADEVIRISPDRFGKHLSELSRVAGKQTSVFVLSDFMAAPEQWETILGNLSANTSIYSAVMIDPAEQLLPEKAGLIDLFDPESARVLAVDTVDNALCQQYQAAFEAQLEKRVARLRRFSKPLVVSTAMQPVNVLAELIAHKPVGVRAHGC